MMQLELHLDSLIYDHAVTFGVDIEHSGAIYMPMSNFDLIGENLSALQFSSTDPGLDLHYAPCPDPGPTPTDPSSWGRIKQKFRD